LLQPPVAQLARRGDVPGVVLHLDPLGLRLRFTLRFFDCDRLALFRNVEPQPVPTDGRGRTPEQLWSTYIQLTRAEDAFRTLKSQELLRPIWHQLGNRVKAHVFVCVLAYLLWKALEHMLRAADLMTAIRKPDEQRGKATPQGRPLSVAMALKRMHDIQIGDILLETVDGRNLRLRRVARPNPEQAELLAALKLDLPERLVSDTQAQPRADAGPARQSGDEKMQ
jgi:hypothetical protein